MGLMTPGEGQGAQEEVHSDLLPTVTKLAPKNMSSYPAIGSQDHMNYPEADSPQTDCSGIEEISSSPESNGMEPVGAQS